MSELQTLRRRQAEIGHYLSLDSEMLNSVFREKLNSETFLIVSDFLKGQIPTEDLRIKKELLTPHQLHERIAKHISDPSVCRWIDFGVRETPLELFQSAIEQISHCVGGLRFAKALVQGRLVRTFFLRCLSSDSTRQVNWIADALSGSQETPSIAAEIVYEFVRAIRDVADERSILAAFFEGFSVEVGTPKAAGFTFAAKWSSAPMLQALVKADKETLAHLHEDFIRTYMAPLMQSDDLDAGHWQRKYDQHFQMLLNLQSGMFLPGSTFRYGEL